MDPDRRRGRPIVRRSALAITVLLAVALGAPAGSASAHAAFLSSDPVDGEVFEAPPARATLQFSEKVLLDASSVSLLELGSGADVQLAAHTTGDGRGVVATLPQLAKGAYILRFVVVDPADLHRTVGSVAFGVGVAAPPSVAGGQIDASVPSIVARSLADLALMLLVGAASLLGFAAVAIIEHVRERLLRCVSWAAAVCAGGWLVAFVVEGADIGTGRVDWFRLLITSDPGRRTVIGAVGALSVLWLHRLGPALTAESATSFGRVLAGVAGVFVLVGAYGGHSAVGGNQAVGLLLRFVHLGAVALWVGVVAVGWWTARRGVGDPSIWPFVSRVATVAVGLVAVSGLLISGRTISTVTALLSTQYGALVIAKIALFALAALLGGVAFWRVSQREAPSVAPELLLMVTAVVVAALLGGSAPATGPQFAGVHDPLPQVTTADLADLTVSATVTPARPGANLLQVEVLNTRRPAPGDIVSLTVQLIRSGGEVVVEHRVEHPDGVQEWATDVVPAPGAYRLVITVERPAAPVPVLDRPLQIAPSPVRQVPTRVSAADWMPLAAGAAIVVAVATGSAVALRRRGARRTTTVSGL